MDCLQSAHLVHLILWKSFKGLVRGVFFIHLLDFFKKKTKEPHKYKRTEDESTVPYCILQVNSHFSPLHSFRVRGSNGRLPHSVPDFWHVAAGSSREYPKDTADLSEFLCPCAENNQNHSSSSGLFLKWLWKQLIVNSVFMWLCFSL